MQVRLITHGKPIEVGQAYPIDETGNRIRPGTRLTDVTVVDPTAVIIIPGREFDMLRINDLDGVEVGATYEVAK